MNFGASYFKSVRRFSIPPVDQFSRFSSRLHDLHLSLVGAPSGPLACRRTFPLAPSFAVWFALSFVLVSAQAASADGGLILQSAVELNHDESGKPAVPPEARTGLRVETGSDDRVGTEGATAGAAGSAAAGTTPGTGAGAVTPGASAGASTSAVAGMSMSGTGGQASVGVEQLVAAALATHPIVAIKRFEQAAAGSLLQSARLQFFPTPSVSFDTYESRGVTVFRLTQPLWTGGRLTADLSAAELKRARADAAIIDTGTTLALKVVTLYQSLLLQSGRIDSQRRGIAKLEQLDKMIERRFKSGVSAQIDLDLAHARLAQARSDLTALLSAQRTAVSQLSRATGRPLQLDEVVRETLAVAPRSALPTGMSDQLGTLQAVLERALATSSTLQLSTLDARIARIEIDQTRALLWPTVALRAEHQEGSYSGSLPSGGRVSLNVQYSPGAGASVIPQAAAAEVRAQAADEAITAARRDVSDRVESEWLDMQSALTRLPELERTRLGSSDVLESSVRLFVTGRRTWLDLLNSVRELMQTEQLEVDARSTAIGSGYRLSLLAGDVYWVKEGATP